MISFHLNPSSPDIACLKPVLRSCSNQFVFCHCLCQSLYIRSAVTNNILESLLYMVFPTEVSQSLQFQSTSVKKKMNIFVYLTFVISVTVVFAQIDEEDLLQVVRCARTGRIFFKQDNKCYVPHSRDPCAEGD